jgi:hypothetical protein
MALPSVDLRATGVQMSDATKPHSQDALGVT